MVKSSLFAFLILLLGGLAAAAEPPVEIRIVYDGTAANGDFTDDYGFAAVITTGAQRILFDSGSDPELFLRQLAKLDVDPGSITHAVLSHDHTDHKRGLFRLAPRAPSMRVFFLDSFPDDVFEVAGAVGMSPVRVSGPAEIAPGIHTTGPLGEQTPEQALIIDTSAGPIAIVGGGHPGVVDIVKAVREQRGSDSVRLLLGGYHMMSESEEAIQAQIDELKVLGVHQVCPAHCTGERAKRLFRRAWGADCLAAGAGSYHPARLNRHGRLDLSHRTAPR